MRSVESPAVDDALIHALQVDVHHPESKYVNVRGAACIAIESRQTHRARDALVRLLGVECSWVIKCNALQALAKIDPGPNHYVVAASDPHWRVRHEVIRQMLERGAEHPVCVEFSALLGGTTDDRSVGVREFLRYRFGMTD